MKSFLRSLPTSAEFFLVLFISFGLQLYVAADSLASHLMHTAPRQAHISNLALAILVIVEIVALAAVFWIGRVRGWSFATFGLEVSWPLTAAGLLLVIVSAFALAAVTAPLHVLHPTERASPVTGGATLVFILPVLVVNPFFEEVLEAGYIIHTLERWGMWPAVLASAILRAVLHTYLGLNGALCMFSIGMIFGLAYWKWRQLWPLIVAHAIVNTLALLSFVQR